MWKTMDESALKGKKVAELREIAKTFGLKNYQKMKKAELVQALMKDDEPPKKAEQAVGEEVSAEPDHVMAGADTAEAAEKLPWRYTPYVMGSLCRGQEQFLLHSRAGVYRRSA